MTKRIETKAAIESKIIIDKFQPFLSEEERQKKFEQLIQLAEKYNRYDINSFLLEDLEAQIYEKCQNQLGFFLAENLVEIHNDSGYETLMKEIKSLKQYFANTTIIAKTSKMNNFNPEWMILYEDELKTAKNIFQELWNKVSPCFMSVKGSAPFKQEKNPNGDIDICYFFPANSKMGKIQDILKK